MEILFFDTSALINQPNYIFETNKKVIIHSIVLEELDSKAEKSSTNGKNARLVINGLFFLGKKGNLLKGVKTENGIVCFDFRKPNNELLTFGYNPQKHDNMLLSILSELEIEASKNDDIVTLVTGDRGLSLKASDHNVLYLPHEQVYQNDSCGRSGRQWKKETIKKDRRNKCSRRA